MAGKLRLYDYSASPNCYKARLALAELGIDYERGFRPYAGRGVGARVRWPRTNAVTASLQ